MTREDAIDKLQDLWNEVYNEDSDGYDYAVAIDMAIEALQTDEVLCKDCENCLHYDDETESGFLWCTVNTRPTTQNDFCSFAERREP